MTNWLQKFLPPAKTGSRNLPAKSSGFKPPSLATLQKMEFTKGLPPATIIYGIAAGAMFAFSLYFLFRGSWVNGLLILLPAGCFLGFAVHLMKHGQ